MKEATVFDIPLEKHMVMIGETGEGKTPVANNISKNAESTGTDELGVLVFDLEGLGEFNSDLEADKHTDSEEIKEVLQNGGNVVVEVPENGKEADNLVSGVWKLLKRWKLHVLVIADEIQEYGNEGGNPFPVYAKRGRKYGVHLISISQRVANVPKTVATQSNVILHFEVSEMEEKYYNERNIPYSPFAELLEYERHAFKIYFRGEGTSQALKLNI
jgi:Cdc6-like AAA superfamily ATPase